MNTMPKLINEKAYQLLRQGNTISIPVRYDDSFPKLVPHQKFRVSDGIKSIAVEIIDLHSTEEYHYYTVRVLKS